MTTEDYIKTQYNVNAFHTDGQIEHVGETAKGASSTFARWIKASGLGCDSILDAGCRTGYAMETLATEFPAARVVGVDIVPEFIKMADLRGEGVVGDLQDLPFEDEEFDWTFCMTAIEHCPDARKAMSEMMRVTKKGVLVITDLEDTARFNQNPSHYTHHNDPVEWINLLHHPGWWLLSSSVPKFSRIDMLWVRTDIGREYNKEVQPVGR